MSIKHNINLSLTDSVSVGKSTDLKNDDTTHVDKGLVETIDLETIINSLPLTLQDICNFNIPHPYNFESKDTFDAALKTAQEKYASLVKEAGITITSKDIEAVDRRMTFLFGSDIHAYTMKRKSMCVFVRITCYHTFNVLIISCIFAYIFAFLNTMKW